MTGKIRRSVDDYEGYISDLTRFYYEKFPNRKHKIDEFIRYVRKVYDKHNRVYLPHRVMWFLYGRKRRVEKNQHLWMLFLGKRGGEGKSTLAKQCLYFCDPTFNSDTRSTMDYETFIEKVRETKIEQGHAMPSILMDEMDMSVHHMSKQGRNVRTVMTKIRQENLIVGVCANYLTDVPSYIYKLLNTVFYLNDNFRFDLFDESKDRPRYSIVSEIKREWGKEYHAMFKRGSRIQRRSHLKNQQWSGELPFSEKTYAKEKRKDLYKSMEKVVPDKAKLQKFRKEEIILEVHRNNPDLTQTKIAKLLGYSREYVNRTINKRVI